MTTNYNVSFYNFYKYFFSNLETDDPIPKEDFILIMSILRKFYQFILNDIFLIFFKKNKREVLENLNLSSVLVGDEFINLSYLRIEGKAVEVTKLNRVNLSKSPRLSLQVYILSDQIDEKKTLKALDPNLIQAHDAYLCHKTIMETNVLFTIHDCFGALVSDYGQIMDYHNTYYYNFINTNLSEVEKTDNTHRQWYSIFILL